MKVFEHPNLDGDWKCPICGTSEDKEVVFIGIDGTRGENNIQPEQVHLECIDLIMITLSGESKSSLLAQEFKRR